MASDWRLKIERADHHIKALERHLRRFVRSQPYEIVTDPNVQPPDYVFRAKVLKTPPEYIGPIIGDILSNLRAALDTLLYALSKSGERIEFPIYESQERFDYGLPLAQGRSASGWDKIRSIDPEAMAVVEWLQPYYGPDLPHDTRLWMLHALRNMDQHRHLTLFGAVPESATFRIMGPDPEPLRQGGFTLKILQLDVGAFEPDAIVGRAQIIGWPKQYELPRVDVNLGSTFDVTFDPKGPAAGRPVIYTLKAIRDWVNVFAIADLEPYARQRPRRVSGRPFRFDAVVPADPDGPD